MFEYQLYLYQEKYCFYYQYWYYSYSYSHLNEKLFIEQINKLKKLEIVDENTLIYGTHISHDGMPYHELAEERAIKNGYHIAYDGMKILEKYYKNLNRRYLQMLGIHLKMIGAFF